MPAQSNDDALPPPRQDSAQLPSQYRLSEPSEEVTATPPPLPLALPLHVLSSPPSAAAIETTLTWTSAMAPPQAGNETHPTAPPAAHEDTAMGPLTYFTPREQPVHSPPGSTQGSSTQASTRDRRRRRQRYNSTNTNTHGEEEGGDDESDVSIVTETDDAVTRLGREFMAGQRPRSVSESEGGTSTQDGRTHELSRQATSGLTAATTVLTTVESETTLSHEAQEQVQPPSQEEEGEDCEKAQQQQQQQARHEGASNAHASNSPGTHEASSDTTITTTTTATTITSFRFYGMPFGPSTAEVHDNNDEEREAEEGATSAANAANQPHLTASSAAVAALPAEEALRHRNVYDMAQSGSTLVVSPATLSVAESREHATNAAATPALPGLITTAVAEEQEQQEEGEGSGSGASLHWFSESSGAETSGSGTTGAATLPSAAPIGVPTHVGVMIVVVDRGSNSTATSEPQTAVPNTTQGGGPGAAAMTGSSSSTETEGSGGHEEFEVDELMELQRPDCGPVAQAKLLQAMQRQCLRGHNTMLVIAHTPSCTAFAEECAASVLQRAYGQLREATDRGFAEALRPQPLGETCDVTLSAYALQAPAAVYSLLPPAVTSGAEPHPRRLPAVIAANPLSGVHLCSDALVTIRDASELRLAVARMRDVLHRLRTGDTGGGTTAHVHEEQEKQQQEENEDRGRVVWVALDVKQRRPLRQTGGAGLGEGNVTSEATRSKATAHEEEEQEEGDEDVYVFSMQIVLVGSADATCATITHGEPDVPLAHDADTAQAHSLALLRRQIFHGPLQSTVLALVDRGDSARQTRELLHYVRAARACMNEPPRSGSVRRFLSLTRSLVQPEPAIASSASSFSTATSPLPPQTVSTASSSNASAPPQTAMVRAMRADAALLLLQPHVPVPLYYVVTSHDRCAVRRVSVAAVVPGATQEEEEDDAAARAFERVGLRPVPASPEPHMEAMNEIRRGRRRSVLPAQAFITSRHNSNQDEDAPRAGSGLAAARRRVSSLPQPARIQQAQVRPRMQTRRFTQDEDEEAEPGSRSIVARARVHPSQPRLSRTHVTGKEEAMQPRPGGGARARLPSPQTTIEDAREDEQDIEEQRNVSSP